MITETQSPTTTTLLDATALAAFQRDGYIAVPNILTPGEVDAARAALSAIVHRRVALGADAPSRPAVQFEPGYDPDGKEPEAAEVLVRKFMWFVDTDPVLAAFVQPDHPVVQIASQLIGPSPIMFQDMALVKPALIGSEKPWHQDNAYFSVVPLESICGVWIALDDAGVDNGCMHVLPGRHRDGAYIHHHGRDCEIAEEKLPMDEVRPVPIATGGAMFFYGMLPHQTPPNRSPERRRALQFHFRNADSHILAKADYDGVFAENGQPASCEAAR